MDFRTLPTVSVGIALATLSLGCQADKNETDPCADDGQVEMPELSADRIAYIKLDELVEIDAEGNTATYSDIQAHFDDFSEFDPGLTPVVALGPACVGTLGVPVSEGSLIPLSVDELILSSPTLEELRMEQDDAGMFAPVSLDAMFPETGGEPLHIEVTGGDGDGTFPSFEETVETPFPIEDVAVDYKGNGTLDITWAPSESTYFEATLRTNDTSGVDNRLRCFFLADDGCFTVPAEAMDWVRSGGVTDFTLLVERHTTIFSIIEDNALLQIDALRSIRIDFEI